MKTLDEVIDAMERCSIPHYFDCKGCPYEDDDAEVGCRSDDRDADALHYLKEFKRISAKLEKIALGNITETLEKLDNPALDWDELRQMTGKPVWLESHGDIEEFTGWVIVSSVLSDRAHFIFSHYDGNFLTYEMSLPDCTFGTKWQAYRKERS